MSFSNDEQKDFVRTDKFSFFLKGAFSQWHLAPFMVDGTHFSTCEQWMMFQKATIFGDLETAAKVLSAKGPRECKELGRSVRNFNQQIWNQVKFGIVFSGNFYKFNFHAELRKILLQTNGTLIVEANPYDNIWGIGMGIEEPGIHDRKNWKGKNLLGLALTYVRESLIFKYGNPEIFKIGESDNKNDTE